MNISVNYYTEHYFNKTVMTGFPQKEGKNLK